MMLWGLKVQQPDVLEGRSAVTFSEARGLQIHHSVLWHAMESLWSVSQE